MSNLPLHTPTTCFCSSLAQPCITDISRDCFPTSIHDPYEPFSIQGAHTYMGKLFCDMRLCAPHDMMTRNLIGSRKPCAGSSVPDSITRVQLCTAVSSPDAASPDHSLAFDRPYFEPFWPPDPAVASTAALRLTTRFKINLPCLELPKPCCRSMVVSRSTAK